MRIKENKSYRTREGTTVTNLKLVENGTDYIFGGYITDPESKEIEYRTWTKRGSYFHKNMKHPLDLIEEINQ